MRHRRALGLVPVFLAFTLAASPSPSLQQLPPPAAPADADRVFRDVLTHFYDACARKDLPAAASLWHSLGPARHGRNVLEVDFEQRSVRLVSLALKDVTVDSTGGRARAVIELSVTDAKTRQTRTEWRVRDFTFYPENGAWRIWNEAGSSATRAGQLASRLLSAPPAERAALLASDPEFLTDEALAGLGAAGVHLRSQGSLDAAARALEVRAEIARRLTNLPILANTLQDVGLVRQVQGRLDEAGRALAEARELFLLVGTRLDVAAVDANLASVDYLGGDHASAARRYKAALDTYEAQNDSPRTATTLHSYANALYMLGEFDQALAAYQRSLSMHEQAGDKYSAASVLQAIALVRKEEGDFPAAIGAYSRSAALGREVQDAVTAARAEHGLGETYRLTGDHPRALRHFSASIAVWEKTRDAPNHASTLYAAGHVYALQRDFGRALEKYQEAFRLDESAGEAGGLARDLGGLGGAHAGQGQVGLALEAYAKSLRLREQLRDTSGAMWTLVHIGVLQTAQGRHSEALEAYQKALQVAEPAGDAAAVSTILALRAANELVREDAAAALASATKAAEIAERIELFDVLAVARMTAGKALRRAGRVEEARAALTESVAALERVPVGPASETFFDDRRGPYVALVDLLVSENRGAEALEWSERARVRGLALLFGGDGSAIAKGLTAAERDEERSLARQYRLLQVRLRRERARDKPDEARIAKAHDDLERARADREALGRRLSTMHPDVAVLRGWGGPATLQATGRALRPSEAVIAFLVTDTRTHAFVVTRDPASHAAALARIVTIDTSARELSARVSAFREALATRSASAQSLARELGNLFLEPVRPNLARLRAITIVPDAFLWALPFEALQDRGGRYLVQDVAVAYAPSLTALVAMRAAAPGARPRPFLVAAADPTLSPSAAERLGVACGAPGPAPSARREVTSIAALFGASATRSAIGEQARAERLLAAARSGSAVHVGARLCLDDASPLYSLLALPNGRGDAEEDDLVSAADITTWTLPSEFVMLTRAEGVRTGTSGDSLVGLAWSLFVAGTPTTVVSRWMPKGTGGTKAIVAFYRSWAAPAAQRATPAEALQRAARSLIAQPGSHPADWAGLMVMGR